MTLPRLAPLAIALLAATSLALAACGDGGGTGGNSTAVTAATDTGTAAVSTEAGASGCSAEAPEPTDVERTFEQPPPREIKAGKTYRATLRTTCGAIVIALDAKGAPNTVNNFVALARRDFYDGLTFHRVIADFVIQGGDPEGNGSGGPGYSFPDELPDGYELGSLAMANSGPDTNGSQFFIVTGQNGVNLPPLYSRFGKVVKGLDVAKRIEGLADPANPDGTPTQPVYILDVGITER